MISPQDLDVFFFSLHNFKMSCVFVCFSGTWKEAKKEYVGSQIKGLNVNVSIKFEEFLGEIYRINGINSTKKLRMS